MKKSSLAALRPCAAIAVVLATAMAPPALSQGNLEEVIVTAQKREQSLQDVPVAVTAFNAEMLQRTGVKDMFDLQSNAPSLIVSQNQTSTTTTFQIRGIFTSSQNFGLEPSVGLYVDGVYRARQGSMINNLVDVASVEVLRGPQGTLFGRNTPAGAIQIDSVAPDFEGTGFIEGTAGNLDLQGASGARSFTVIDDVLAVRATGFIMERDGFVDWVHQGEKENDAINDRDRWGLRFQALYTPTENLSIRFIGDHSEVDETCCAVGSFKNNFIQTSVVPSQEPAITGTDTNIANIGGTVIDQRDFYDYAVSVAKKPESHNEDEGVSLQINWDTDHFSLTSISAYRAHDSYDNADIVFNDLDGAYRANDASQDQYTQEFRLANSGDKLSYVAGLYYYRQQLDNNRSTTVGEDLSAMLLGVPSNLFVADTGSFDTNDQEHTSYAAFGQVDYQLTDTLLLTAGLRWTYEEKEIDNVYTQDYPREDGGNFGFTQFPPLSPQQDLHESFDDNKTTGTVKLSWFMTDDIMFYASYGTGYKSGGANADRINTDLDNGGITPLFDPETSDSTELGMKADFPEQALRANVALHYTKTEDLQTVSFQGGGFALENAGTAETYGVELELLWLPTDNTTLTLGYAYNHGEYEDFERGPCWTSTPWHNGFDSGIGAEDPRADANGYCDNSGGDLSGNPENVLVVSANQRFDLTGSFSAFLYGEYIYTDERMTDVNNDPAKYDGSYSLVNLRAGLTYQPWDTELVVWGRNVLDEDATNTIADAPGQPGRLVGYYQETATWGLTLRKDF